MAEEVNDIFSLNRVQLMQLIKLTVAQTYPEEFAYKERVKDNIKAVVSISKSYNGDLPNIDSCKTVDEYKNLIENVKNECINNAQKIENELAAFREDSILRIEKIIDEEWDFNQKVKFYSDEEINEEYGCKYNHPWDIETLKIPSSMARVGYKQVENFDKRFNDFSIGLVGLDKKLESLRSVYKEIDEINFLKEDYGIGMKDDRLQNELISKKIEGLNYIRPSYFVEFTIKINAKKRYIKDIFEYLKEYRKIYLNGGGAWYVYNKYKRRPNHVDRYQLRIGSISMFSFKSTIDKAKSDVEHLKFPDINEYYEEEIIKWNEDHADYDVFKLRKEDLLLDKAFIREMLINQEKHLNKKYFYSCHSFIYCADDTSIPYPLVPSKISENYKHRNDTMKRMPVKDSAEYKLIYDLEKPLIPFLALIANENKRYDKKVEEIKKKYRYGYVFDRSNKLSFNSQNSNVRMTNIFGENFDNAMIGYLNQNQISKKLAEEDANLITCFPRSYQKIQIGTMNRSNNLIMIYRILEDGRADSWKEAVNLLEDDKFRRNVVASLGEINNGIHSVVYQIAEEGRRLNKTITDEFFSTRNMLEKNNEEIKSTIERKSETTNKNISEVKSSMDNLTNRVEDVMLNTLDITSIFEYLKS